MLNLGWQKNSAAAVPSGGPLTHLMDWQDVQWEISLISQLRASLDSGGCKEGQKALGHPKTKNLICCTKFNFMWGKFKQLFILGPPKGHKVHFWPGFGLRGKNRTTTFPTYLYILSPCEGSLGVGGWKLVNLDTQRVTKCKNKLEICMSYFFPSSQTQAKNALCGLRGPQIKKFASSDPN